MKYRIIAPSLMEPVPETIDVPGHTGITISVPSLAQVKNKLIVRMAGQLLFERGRLAQGWKIDREWKIDGRQLIRFVSQRALEPHDYLVQIEVVGLCRSINQRFVVRGSRVDCPCPHDEPVLRVPGGFFWIDGCTWHLPDRTIDVPAWYGRAIPVGDGCAVYRRAGIAAWRHGQVIKTCALPRCLLEPQVKLSMLRNPPGTLSVSGCSMYTGELWLLHQGRLSHWPMARALDAALTSGWLNVNMGDHSRHIPLFYKKSPADKDTSDFFEMRMVDEMNERWSMRWSDTRHIWYTRRSIIVQSDIRIYEGKFESKRIDSEAINGDIFGVDFSGSSHICVNGEKIIRHAGSATRSMP